MSISSFDPPRLGDDGRVLEGLITTESVDGSVNISPMGPIVDDALERLWLRPFRTSTTYQNLKRTGVGIFHITDDVELIAQTAVGGPETRPRLISRSNGTGAILADACRWYALELEFLDDCDERTSIVARVVEHGTLREFLGFNRAKHAVIEAAILATRIHLIDRQQLAAEFHRLVAPVEKTGAAAEVRAFEFLREYFMREIGRQESST
jgi:hypothetical protein